MVILINQNNLNTNKFYIRIILAISIAIVIQYILYFCTSNDSLGFFSGILYFIFCFISLILSIVVFTLKFTSNRDFRSLIYLISGFISVSNCCLFFFPFSLMDHIFVGINVLLGLFMIIMSLGSVPKYHLKGK